ncbi:MAG: HAD-IG family 5'-nucleotidase [Bdellovibrionales bacterium]|nr:HAD-IG family 5'-nucleotidase [Bdellovibrionales bacterium]
MVFVNRTLNLKKINYIGFDMDHTLIRYNSDHFESLAHSVMLEKLVSDKDYPKSILNLKFDFDRAIRGLVIDRKLGNVLKLSRHSAIRTSYHGLNALDYKTQRRLYKSTYIDLSDPSYDTIDTTFSIAYAGLFMQLVDLKESSEKGLPDFQIIAEDLNYVLDRGHRDGSIKSVVENKISDFVIKDPDCVQGLEKFVKHHKKLFVITNSDFHYTKMLLDHAINPFLKNHSHWSELFEFTITSAQKPAFFTEKRSFLKVNPEDGSMTNLTSKITPGIYQGGCATTFTNDLELSPDEILYIGDHIYGDIVRLKKDCAWRTALVVEELEAEVQKLRETQKVTDEIDILMEKKIPLETKIDALISENIETGTKKNEKKIDDLIHKINDIDKNISPLIKKRQSVFNPLWGEVMRVGIEESYFAYQVERFACVYMSRLSELLALSPRTYFRSMKKPLAHDIQKITPAVDSSSF